ncbi:hypothetical protein LJR074_003506 [Acidovorax sp. LjRoot74]|uniref:hypothetical protein n=1 Tax=Acidovorax sp. LjRoot74 TaxID=3342337 RepID=UPI003ED09606
MSEVTTRPATRATKAPSSAKAAPAHAAADAPPPDAPETASITQEEALVANTLAGQLRGIYDVHNMQMSVNGSELLHAAADDLEAPQDCERAIHRAAAAVYGAIAVERAERPGSPVIAPLEVVHQSLRTASNGYSFEEEGCEAMAEGIRAGQRSAAAKDELTIAAKTAALLTQAVDLINDEAGTVYASTLLEFGKKVLQQVVDGNLRMGTVQEAFFYAAGACAGALAMEQRDHPSARHRHQLLDAAYQVLNNAGLSYDCELNANDVAAAAIKAGARQFRDRPAPPIRRVDESAPTRGYSRAQMLCVLEFIAGAAHTSQHLLMLAQQSDELFEIQRMVDGVELVMRQIGGAADAASGSGIVGDFASWNCGPTFPRTGVTE